jgi:RNA polymerase sigma-70 factor (ECF subfamily)
LSHGGSEFQEIHNAFRPKILRYLKRFVGEHEAEDLTQEVFIKVNQALETFKGESQVATWIYRIATNAALDRLRRASSRGETQKRPLEDELEVVDIDMRTGEKRPSLESSLIHKEMDYCIRSLVDNLPQHYRAVIVLSELEGFRNDEIANILGISLGTVKIRLHRARTRLKKELENHCKFYRDERNELACELKDTFKELKKLY